MTNRGEIRIFHILWGGGGFAEIPCGRWRSAMLHTVHAAELEFLWWLHLEPSVKTKRVNCLFLQ